MFPAHLIGDDLIGDQARSLLDPPLVSILRVNSLATEFCGGNPVAFFKKYFNDPAFSISSDLRTKNQDIIQIQACGPFVVDPAPRRVIVFNACARAVMRGSHIFAPGVIALEDRCVTATDRSFVSVWLDLEEKCTRGLRKAYTGNVKFIGNGKLLMVNTFE